MCKTVLQNVPRFLLSLMLMSAFLFLGNVFEASATTLPFQARLAKPNGTKVADGCYTMRFAIYDQKTAGTALWEEVYAADGCDNSDATDGVSVSDGIFNVYLGTITPITTNFASSGTTYYLGITVVPDSEMTPRHKIGGSATAINAGNLGGLVKTDFTLDQILSHGATSTQSLTAGSLTSGSLTLSGTTLQSTGELSFADSRITTAIPFSDSSNTSLVSGTSLIGAINAAYTAANSATVDTSTLLLKASNLSDVASTSSARTNLGLGSIALQNAEAVTLTGGSISGITDLALADGGTGASTAVDARTNLGLGTIATQAASSVALTGGTLNNVTIGATTASTGAFTTLGASGATTLGSTFNVSGATTLTGLTATTGSFSSTLGVTGAATLSSTATVVGAATLQSTLSVSGNTTLSGTLGVTGASTLATLTASGLATLNSGITIAPTSALTTAINLTNTNIGTGIALALNDITFTGGSLAKNGNSQIALTATGTSDILLDASGNFITLGGATGDTVGFADGAETIFFDNDVTPGITDIMSNTVYGTLGTNDDMAGGLRILGISDSDLVGATALGLNGYVGLPSADALQFNGAAVSGTSIAAIGDTSVMAVFTNNSSPLLTIFGNGNVGLGDPSPDTKLKIVGALCVADDPLGVDCAGNVAGTIYAVNTVVQTADLAENYLVSDSASAGDLVMLDFTKNQTVKKATADRPDLLVGILSTNPGITLGGETTNGKPVVLAGRIPVNVNMEGGSISIGDRITTSSVSGVGRKATFSEPSVGIAIASASAPGQVMVIVNHNTGYQELTQQQSKLSTNLQGVTQELQNVNKQLNPKVLKLDALEVEGATTMQTLTIAKDASVTGTFTVADSAMFKKDVFVDGKLSAKTVSASLIVMPDGTTLAASADTLLISGKAFNFAQLQGDLAEATKNIATLDARLTTLEKKVDEQSIAVANQFVGVDTSVQGLAERVASVNTTVAALQQSLQEVQEAAVSTPSATEKYITFAAPLVAGATGNIARVPKGTLPDSAVITRITVGLDVVAGDAVEVRIEPGTEAPTAVVLQATDQDRALGDLQIATDKAIAISYSAGESMVASQATVILHYGELITQKSK